MGAWSLDAFFAVGPDDKRVFPYGEDVTGLLVYADSGWMSAVLSRSGVDRRLFGGDTLERAAAASKEDKVRAFDSYTSYAGRYALEGDVVAHTVTHSLVPTLVGQTLRRHARFDSETLVLQYDVEGRTRRYRYELRWVRA